MNLLEENNNISLGKILLLFYAVIASSSLFPLLSKQLKEEIKGNRIAQHVVAITVLLSIILTVSNGQFEFNRIILYTLIGYLIFILSTKMDLQWNIMIIISILSFVIYQEINKHNELKLLHDKNINDDNKNEIIKNNNSNYVFIAGIIAAITIAGTLFYSEKKEGQYGGGYNLLNFLVY
ncbi:hypothetical protein BMW23_0424 [Bodo saltans virus]|uniref:Uncharacterized protein n=1 Tax=Bodo saltans virus TaxID=2024608 RepID=A0A2H4UUD6_9VIRU|nr:hypothetical protein QJ851_gp0413 [Bodo saltans virus]ATZ80476.1 hypothetical protein BMW23_0424 [Bodo saltans virus]